MIILASPFLVSLAMVNEMTENPPTRSRPRSRAEVNRRGQHLGCVPDDIPNGSELHALDLSFNEIQDMTNLEGFRQLRYLDLGSNRISRIHGLGRTIKLETLYLNDNKLQEIAGLARLKSLKRIRLHRNHIAKIIELPRSLSNIDICCNDVVDLSGLRRLCNLEWLSASHNQIEDLSPISQCKALQDLQLDYNKISNALPLQPLIQLTSLNLAHNRIASIQKLPSIPSLIELFIGFNGIASGLAGLAKRFPKLLLLDVEGNAIESVHDCDSLSDIVPLTELIVKGNPLCKTSEYVNELRKRLPRVEIIDGEVLERLSEQDKLEMGETIEDVDDDPLADEGNSDKDSDEEPRFSKTPKSFDRTRHQATRQNLEETLQKTQQMLEDWKGKIGSLIDSSRRQMAEAILDKGGTISDRPQEPTVPRPSSELRMQDEMFDDVEGNQYVEEEHEGHELAIAEAELRKKPANMRAKSAGSKSRLRDALRFSQVYADASRVLKRTPVSKPSKQRRSKP